MKIIKHKTNIDFIGKRRPALFLSSVLNLAIIVGVVVVGFNYGVDFAGGTLMELKFDNAITAEQLREAALKGGLSDPSVQGIGAAEEHDFLLRLGGMTQLTKEVAASAEGALKALPEVTDVRKPDIDNGLITFRTKAEMNLADVKSKIEASGAQVYNIAKLGEENGTWDYQVKFAGMSEKATASLQKTITGNNFKVLRTDYVGPAVGRQLRNKGIMALVWASLAILIYVAFRFDLKFGPGALVAMVHDVVMVAGYYLVSRREFNLTSIAVLLTVLGYSINDTIVVYDRIREEMARFKGKPLPEIINIAVNETLSRTILTSGVTALSLVGLLVFGVGEIFDFAAAMLTGIVVGTYSSVYIASPLTIWLDERAHQKDGQGNSSALKSKPA
ncbi:MAG: protein translocase subunit SecF [Myxococcaceae bacterium]